MSNRRHSLSSTSTPDSLNESSFFSSQHSNPHLQSSIQSNPPSRYRPRPLLLSTFGTYNSKRPSASQRITSQHQSSFPHLNLDQLQRDRHQAALHKQINKSKKRARQAELSTINSDDDDRWSWLSAQDQQDTYSSSSDAAPEDEDEDMAVVWRASLDVGRRVSKNRLALGKRHALLLSDPLHKLSTSPPYKPSSTSYLDILKSSFTFRNPINFVRNWFFIHKNHRLSTYYGPIALFGSGILGGMMCTLISVTSIHAITTRPSIALFANIFPHQQFGGMALLGGVGIFYQWQ